MLQKKQILEARIAIAAEAGSRWKERTEARVDIERRLRAGGPAAADRESDVSNFRQRRESMARRATAFAAGGRPIVNERIIGATVDFLDRPGSEAERRAGRPVGRVVQIRGPGYAHLGFGTGFLITPELLLTNHHVLATAGDAAGCGVQFGYEHSDGGLSLGQTFEFQPKRFFVSDKALDYAIVAVSPKSLEGAALPTWSFHPLIATTGKVLIGHPINIIQHPDGGPKQYASTNNEVVDRLEDFLHYRTDTRPGSSGSAGFNAVWEVVVLHHSGVPAMKGDVILNDLGEPWLEEQGDDRIKWIANEGVRVSRILASVRSLTFDDPAKARLRDSILASRTTEGALSGLTGTEKTPAEPVLPDGTSWRPLAAGGATLINVQGNATIHVAPERAPATDVAAAVEGLEGLALAQEKKLVRDPDYGRRRGYDSGFLRGFEVPLPVVRPQRAAELIRDRFGNPQILDYHHFSLTMNRRWLLQMWSAANVDYSPEFQWAPRKAYGNEDWIHDPRLPQSLQIDDAELYKPAEKFDRGHVVRRDDCAWGATWEEAEYANSDTFHWTNCTPQHEGFNQSSKRGLWGRLENHIARASEAVGNRAIILGGPVLDRKRAIPHDFGGGEFLVPLDYWKVVVVQEAGSAKQKSKLRAYAFVLEQESIIKQKGLEGLSREERFAVGDFAAYQHPLAEVGSMTGIVFPDVLLKADAGASLPKGKEIRSLADAA